MLNLFLIIAGNTMRRPHMQRSQTSLRNSCGIKNNDFLESSLPSSNTEPLLDYCNNHRKPTTGKANLSICVFVCCLALAKSLCEPPRAGRRTHGILRPPDPVVPAHVGMLKPPTLLKVRWGAMNYVLSTGTFQESAIWLSECKC